MSLPVVGLRVGLSLQRVIDVVGADVDDIRVKAGPLIASMTTAEQQSLLADVASLGDQFDPDAAYVLLHADDRRGLTFDDDRAFIRWMNAIEAGIRQAIDE